MLIENEERGDLIIMRIKGGIDLENFPELKRTLAEVVNARFKTVILNLGEVDAVSSSGAGAFVTFEQDLKKGGGKLLLANLSPRM